MSDQSLDKSKCIDGSYGWVVVLFTMLVGFVPGSNMAKAISLAPIVCMNFQINEATFGLIVASFYIMGFIMAFPTTGLVNKLGMKGSVAIAVGCGIIGSIMGAMAGTNLTVFVVSRVIEGASFGIMGVVGASSIGPWFSPKKRSLPLSILAGIVGGAVPSILWQFTPNTVEDADIPAANAFMAFTQNIGMTIGALIIGNAIVMWGWSMGSLIGMVPLYIICLIIYFAFGVQKKLKL